MAGLILLGGVLEAVCGLKNDGLASDSIKLLGIHLSYHNETKTT